MSSLIQCFAAIAESIRKSKNEYHKATPLTKYVFEYRRTCPNYRRKKVLPKYCHFN